MTVLQLGAFALSTLAGVSTDDAAKAEGEWLGLDQEIQNLATSLNTAEEPGLTGFLRVRVKQTSDFAASDEGTPGTDFLGTDVTQARVQWTGVVGDYSYLIEYEMADSISILEGGLSLSGGLLDAKIWWPCGEYLTVTFGQFKVPFSRGFLTARNMLAFLDRAIVEGGTSDIANLLGYDYFFGFGALSRDQGIMLSGETEMFAWYAAIQNGIDSRFDEHRFTGRIQAEVMGEGVAHYQGAYNLADETALSVGAAFSDDGAFSNGQAITVDARLNMGQIAADAAFYDLDEDIGDNSPFWVAFYYQIQTEWGLGVRWEDLDLTIDTSILTFGATWYQGGTGNKWNFEVVSADSDDPDSDGTILQAGYTLSF
jgi:hypothetical protein